MTVQDERDHTMRRSTFVAVIALVVTLPLGNVSLGPFQLVQAMAFLAVATVATVAAMQLWLPLPPWQIGLPLATMVVSAALASLGTPVPGVSLHMNVALAIGVLVLVAMWAVVDEAPRLIAVVSALVLAGGIVGVVSLASAGDLSTAAGGAIVRGRASGVFAQPNELGIFAAMLLPVALALALATSGLHRVAAGTGAVLVAAALTLSLSRGAWFGAAVGVLALLVLLPERRRRVGTLATGAAALGTLVLLLAPPSMSSAVSQRVSSMITGDENPYDERSEVYAEAARQIADSPVVGQGPGAFSMTARGLTPDGYDLDISHAHSLVLVVATEYGVLGVLALLGLGLGLAHVLRRSVWPRSGRPRGEAPQVTIVAAGLVAGLAAAFAHGVVDYPLRNPVSGMTAWLVLALTVASVRCLQRPVPDLGEEGRA